MEIRKRIEQHLNVLCNEIGARPTGSKANQAAVEYVCEEFKRAGLNVLKQEFDCMDWSEGGGTLTIEGQDILTAPAPYSLPCNVQGELVCIHTLEELRITPISGKIVLLCDALAAEPLMPKSFIFWNPEEHKETIALLERGGAQAVLTVSLSPECFVPIIEDGDFEIPCAMVLPGILPLLSSGLSATLSLNTKRRPARAANVLATHGKGKHKICMSAHIDTKPATPGALDNASGVAVLLALAEELSDRELPYQIEFVLFNGEDYYSNPGEMAYLASYLSTPADYVCAFNIDGVGVKGQALAYSFYECSEKLINNLSKLAAEIEGFEQIDPWPQGDHTLFSFSGVPAISVTSSGIFDLVDSVLHSDRDSLELIDTEILESLVKFLLYSI
ncbi:M28 family peptidase [Faecalicatena sp. AGMB00832]|uniref:M28 family peptidase n=1 Tax=Faecalicatena faecalis TaxID=2726362 RepID=A0ABS6D4L3_9FIRM|nr:M28 family peptidase [Faecalicatena faecalis]MBU3876421.1 M28 family peptidase [Faecalicatena faecalis]